MINDTKPKRFKHIKRSKVRKINQDAIHNSSMPSMAESSLSSPVIEDSKLKRHSLNVSNGVKCPTCPQWFKNETRLFIHSQVHLGKTECSLCGRILSNIASLHRHMRNVNACIPKEVLINKLAENL